MRRISTAVLLGTLLAGSAMAGSSSQAAGSGRAPAVAPKLEQPRPAWRPGELLVQFRRGAGKVARRQVHTALGSSVLRRIGSLGVDQVRLPKGVSVAAAAASYLADPMVAHVEANAYRYPLEKVPTDAGFVNQWGLRNTGQAHEVARDSLFPELATAAGTADADIDASDAWETEPGDPTTVVAIIDSGVDTAHPDLIPSLWPNPLESGGAPGVDDDGNGLVDDVNGWDFAENDATVFEPNPTYIGYEHGTHVAGIVAANLDDLPDADKKVVGVCPDCAIMVLKFMKPEDIDGDLVPDVMLGDLASELAALAYAKAEGADIVNASYGINVLWSKLEREAIRAAENDFLLVAAAGNSSGDNDLVDFQSFSSPGFPASYTLPNIISVAATNHHDQYGRTTECTMAGGPLPLCQFSSWGHDSVDVGAPGVDIFSTLPGKMPGPTWDTSYDAFDGTSMAAPHVAGVAGLIESFNLADEVAPVVMKNMIMNSAEVKPSLGSLWANGKTRTGAFTRTSGRVNANLALMGSVADATPLTDGNIDGARSMPKGSKNGSVRYPDDVNDVYKKTLRPGRYVLLLVVPKGKDYDLYVWRPGTTEIWQYEDPCLSPVPGTCKELRHSFKGKGKDEQVTFRVKNKKKYYFQVNSYFSTGKYLLVIRRI